MLTRAVNPSPPPDGLRFHELDICDDRPVGAPSHAAAISLVVVLSALHCSNAARQASLRLAFCRRRQEIIARTFGISPGQRR
jgi:hypothetical protein